MLEIRLRLGVVLGAEATPAEDTIESFQELSLDLSVGPALWVRSPVQEGVVDRHEQGLIDR